jgi:hypothetical protein
MTTQTADLAIPPSWARYPRVDDGSTARSFDGLEEILLRETARTGGPVVMAEEVLTPRVMVGWHEACDDAERHAAF